MSTSVRVALSIAVAGGLTALALWWSGLEPREVADALGRLTLATWLPAFGLHFVLYVLRAWRFALLLPKNVRVQPAPFLAVCGAHTLAAFVLPAKLGEATFVVYANRACGVPAHAGIASLVVSRLLDLAVLAAGFSIACFVIAASAAFPAIDWFVPLGGGLAVVAVVLFWLTLRSDLLARFASATIRFLGIARTALGARVATRIDGIAGALREAGGEGRLLRAALVSIPIWFVIFLFCAVLARALGLPASTTLAEATFGSSLAILTSLIPVSAFANFGTLELGWVLGFGTLGVSHDLALATGLGLHAVQLVHIVALGLISHAFLAAHRPR
ncbi:MAG: lysylphosphatidylglycerol synthase transmembrane domain-containing protein [Planctomycetota bacterium]|nr:lysylphosphatidylglycerol synthase transmembrane domain-containing protein [Planctomycetota bacterium]